MPSVFFIHDAIPIDYPEFCSPARGRPPRQAAYDGVEVRPLVIVDSEEIALRGPEVAEQSTAREPRIEVVPLGIDNAFCDEREKAPIHGEGPYFLYVGTIEPRKNACSCLRSGVGWSSEWERRRRDW